MKGGKRIMLRICDFCPVEDCSEYGCLMEYQWESIPESDKLFYSFAKDYPNLAQHYNDYMAGECDFKHLSELYYSNEDFRKIIDEAKKKHSYFIEDMGL
jgi:hypothetical protein